MGSDAKPLGRKAYGSIPHLPGSRMGPGDHHCHEGQARICTERVRDRHDEVFVEEKLDGGCVAVAKNGGRVLALGRAGYLAETSPFKESGFPCPSYNCTADIAVDVVLAAFEDAGIVLSMNTGRYDSWGDPILAPLESLPDAHDATRGEGET